MKKVLYLLLTFSVLLSACNWFKTTPEVGLVLSKHFNDKLYKDFDTAAYNVVFNRHFDSLKSTLSNPKVIGSYYSAQEHRTDLVTRFFTNGELDTLKNYISASTSHGFNPEIFRYTALNALLSKLSAHQFKSIADVYPVIADLELTAAASLLKYDTFIGYGSIIPRKVLNRYYVSTIRPDSASMLKVLESKSLAQLLRSIQPAGEDYLSLERELANLKKSPSVNAAAIKAIEVNMERLRWKIAGIGDEYVEVNIPDFSLTWFSHQDTVTHMKVCVGGRREKDYEEKMKVFLKTHSLDDKPKNHQTPILLSKFNSIQVNPVWNIPVSIAQSEIYYQAMRDPYYLSNNNMRVYYKGQLIADPDTIQWRKYPREHLPFQFKQGSGEGNALGKFKFIFDNGSSIYLHDTNNKSAFMQSNRAISHGCVRVERPLEFAEKLVDNKYQYDQLRMEVNLPPIDTTKMAIYQKRLAKKADTVNVYQVKPKWFGTKKNVAVFINYKTAWAENGRIEFRNDIYDLDDAIYTAMKKFR
ncbi:L,D-transpeptidase catalytic domain [Pedobacter westerhofensis]|uniref:L,D-transpeptidase catalytic domain n=1 Tax=Pedobacter westerhofensis TaxID=425512 RepID=A0A521FPD4_9SPHI|nr:L,D-transpeptidase family protein [Pedobacter westerhofensis]SMO98028.1 L,D-transpeptidase catalytic domain [Pedobacter westerhofensis]